jgi:hypothetical protein
MRIGKKAQSVLEYVIVLTVVIGVIIVVAAGAIRGGVEDSLEAAGDSIGAAGANIP